MLSARQVAPPSVRPCLSSDLQIQWLSQTCNEAATELQKSAADIDELMASDKNQQRVPESAALMNQFRELVSTFPVLCSSDIDINQSELEEILNRLQPLLAPNGQVRRSARWKYWGKTTWKSAEIRDLLDRTTTKISNAFRRWQVRWCSRDQTVSQN